MSRANQEMVRQYEDGWRSVGKKFVCPDCFDDIALKDFIETNAVSRHCDYCQRTTDHSSATHMDSILALIAESLRFEFGDPDAELPYESAEGGYQGDVYDTFELLFEVIGFSIENEELSDDIVRGLTQELWCRASPFSLLENEELLYTWKDFCEAVKHHTRYLFFSDDETHDSNRYRPSSMLDDIGNILWNLDLVRTINTETAIIRARVEHMWTKLTAAKELGAPPLSIATQSNRMSPAGIPMFYGALEADTALAEIANLQNSPCHAITFATFIPLRDLNVVDFTNLPEIPSLFSERMRHLRPSVAFLHEFIQDLSKPIVKDQKEHIEYVPSQIVTEYLRHRFMDQRGNHLDGLIYPSSVAPGGSSIVLFVTNEQCLDNTNSVPDRADPVLLLKEVQVARNLISKFGVRAVVVCVQRYLSFLWRNFERTT